MQRWRYVVVGVGIALVAACSGGDGDGDDSSDPAPERTTEDSTTTTAPETTSSTTVAAPEPTAPAGDAGDAGDTDDAGAFTLPDAVGLDLQAAQDAMQAAGFHLLTSHDATGQGRLQVLDRNWKVCSQTPAPGTPTSPTVAVDFGAVKDSEDCP